MNKKQMVLLCVSSLAVNAVFANNGDQMVGLSGISSAMSGAVVAMPQDSSTLLSNPAGLAFLDLGETDTRFDMNVSILNPNRSLNDVESDSSVYVLATGGFAFKSEMWGKDLTVGIGANPVSGGGVDFPNSAFTMGPASQAIVATRTSMRIGPSVAYQPADNWSVGGNLSLTSNAMSLRRPTSAGGNFPMDVAYGYAFGFGTVYKPAKRVQLGAAYTSQSYSEDLEWNMDDGKYTLEFNDPQTVALGASFQVTPALQVEVDVKWFDYSSVRSSNKLIGPTSATTLTFGWDDQTAVSVGAKYDLTDRTALLMGYNYGESPIGEEDINSNVGVTAIIEHHVSLGLTSRVTKHSSITFSWMRGFENEMEANTLLPGQTSPTKVAFETNLITLQFTYR